ncbi:MAG: hypothetical protein ACKV2V_17760 [Blastocatellia bacterium]
MKRSIGRLCHAGRLFLSLLFIASVAARAQTAPPDPHAQHRNTGTEQKKDGQEKAPDRKPGKEPDKVMDHTAHDDPHAGHMAHAGHANVNGMMYTLSGGPFRSMKAMGSGTALQPATTPMYGWHQMPGGWMLMTHMALKAGYNHQGGYRGVGKAVSQNWLMTMAEHHVGRGRLMLRGMLSAEALTVPHGGVPQLFQTGETYRNRGIIDAQHPHDVFMEMAASYTLPVGERISLHVYGGPVGEPALGPVAFMHRLSAMDNPAVPLAHHWQDSTHITHGVITGGLTISRVRLEMSTFHGREPDENRVGLDMGRLDSFSWRVSWLPGANWALQYSEGFLRNPEALYAGDTRKRTASLMWNRPLGQGNIAAAVVWGRNRELHGVSNSYLAEAALNFRRKNYIYFRGELLDKQGLLEDNIYGRAGLICQRFKPAPNGRGGVSQPEASPGTVVLCNPRTPPAPPAQNVVFHGAPPDTPSRVYPVLIFNQWFRVGALTLGGVRDLIANDRMKIGLGADVTIYRQPAALNPIYGTQTRSWQAFVRFRPAEMK